MSIKRAKFIHMFKLFRKKPFKEDGKVKSSLLQVDKGHGFMV